MSIFDDDLSPEDLNFLNQWDKLGKSDTADAEYTPEMENDEGIAITPEAEGTVEGEVSESTEEGDSEAPEMATEDAESMSLEGESHLEADDGEDHDIEDGESDLEFDDEYDEDALDQLEQDRQDDLEERQKEDKKHLDDLMDTEELPEDGEDAQVEEDDGEGERGNSDEARESDEPIQAIEHDRNAEDIDENLEADDLEENAEAVPKADAETESEDMDAQAELDKKLKENPEAEPEQKADKTDEIPTTPSESEPGAFESVPDAGEACTNHCEDNETEDHDGECPHCKSRIVKERELWGVIATDMNGKDVYPGDKLIVAIPVTFATVDTMLTANVPNQAVDPIRLAEATDGHVDTTLCWLSGRISQFTGWHMQEADNSIWTFAVGKRIGFAQKVGEIGGHDSHGSNADEGDQLDIDDMLRDIEKRGQDESEKEAEEAYDEGEDESNEESGDSEGDDTSTDDAPEDATDGDSDEDRQRKNRAIPKHQAARFENLIERISKKIENTFGGTCEKITISEPEFIDDEEFCIRAEVTVVSRGMTYKFPMWMRRYDAEQDGELLQDIIDEDEANDE